MTTPSPDFAEQKFMSMQQRVDDLVSVFGMEHLNAEDVRTVIELGGPAGFSPVEIGIMAEYFEDIHNGWLLPVQKNLILAHIRAAYPQNVQSLDAVPTEVKNSLVL